MKKIKDFASHHKTPIKFLNSTLLLYAVTLLTSVITYRYIDPECLGIWATFTTFSTLTTFMRLGIVNGMNRELPYYLGKKEFQKAYSYAETALSYTIISMILIVVMCVVFFYTFNFSKLGDLSDLYKSTAIVFFLCIVCEPYSSYLSGTFRTNDHFDKLSNIQGVQALLRFATLILVIKFGYNGYLIRESFMIISGVCLLHFFRPLPHIQLKFSKQCFLDLFKIGFNIFLASYLITFVDTFPRLYIIHEGTAEELGLFSPILVISGIVYVIPNTLSSYLYPKFAYAYGNGESRLYFWNKMKQLLLLSLVIGGVFAIGIYCCIDFIIQYFPKYIASAPYIKLMSIGMLFLGYKVCGLLFVIFKAYKWMWYSPIVYAIVMIISLCVFDVYYNDKIFVASVSLIITNCAMLIYYILSIYYITHREGMIS